MIKFLDKFKIKLMNKLNGNLFFIILLLILIISSIGLLLLKNKNHTFKIYAYCVSAFSFCLISFLIANSLLIKSPSQLSDNLHMKLIASITKYLIKIKKIL